MGFSSADYRISHLRGRLKWKVALTFIDPRLGYYGHVVPFASPGEWLTVMDAEDDELRRLLRIAMQEMRGTFDEKILRV